MTRSARCRWFCISAVGADDPVRPRHNLADRGVFRQIRIISRNERRGGFLPLPAVRRHKIVCTNANTQDPVGADDHIGPAQKPTDFVRTDAKSQNLCRGGRLCPPAAQFNGTECTPANPYDPPNVRRGGVLPLPKGKNEFAGGYRKNENTYRAGGVEPRPYGMTGGAVGRADVVIGPYEQVA